MRHLTTCAFALAVSLCALPALAQQRPLVTEDPEPIGAGRVLVESGVDVLKGVQYPVSGLEGTRVSVLDRLSIGGSRENLAHHDADARFRFVLGDARDGAAVDPLVAAADVVDTTAAAAFRAEGCRRPGACTGSGANQRAAAVLSNSGRSGIAPPRLAELPREAMSPDNSPPSSMVTLP